MQQQPSNKELGSVAAPAGRDHAGDGSRQRNAAGTDADVGWRVTAPWQVDLAVRWEDFEDFGTTTNGKIATNYRFNEAFAIRGSWNTGFRAPTPGQSNASNVLGA
jgi:iron complex outermembrane receptor protein